MPIQVPKLVMIVSFSLPATAGRWDPPVGGGASTPRYRTTENCTVSELHAIPRPKASPQGEAVKNL